nr:MMPL family transporter [uncultured Methylophaga sp.]
MNNFFKFLAWVWLLVVLLLIGITAVNRPVLDTSMMSLLPQSEQQPLVKAASEQMGRQFSQRLLILVTASDKEIRQVSSTALTDSLRALPQVSSVLSQFEASTLTQYQQTLYPYRYGLLTDELVTLIDTDKSDIVKQRALSRILNPVSLGGHSLVDDPFGLQSSWLEQLESPIKVTSEDDYLKLTEKNDTYLVIVNLADDAFSMATQKAVLGVYQQQKDKLEDKGVSLQLSGLLVHADAGAKQAQKEMSTIGIGSLLGIVLLMWWVFKRFYSVTLLLLPVFIGLIVASSVAFLVFERVHIVTFAFGAGLIGVAIDYALHFLCERQQRRDVISHILPGLALGLLSSVLAYAAQAITPFPGLRQMALFSIVGLISAWLTVVLWLPLMTRRLPITTPRLSDRIYRWQQQLPSVGQNLSVRILLIFLTIAAAISVFYGKTEDDIRLLQTSPPELLAQEQYVQHALGLNSSTQFLLNPCEQIELCLQQEEQLKPVLERLQQQGQISHYRMLSESVPSKKTQTDNSQRVERLYQQELSSLYKLLNASEQMTGQAWHKLDNDKLNRLTPDRKDEQGGLLSSPIIESEQAGLATVISLASSSSLSAQALVQLQATVPKLILVDQVDAISNLMQDYRQQIMLWMCLAYIGVFAILFWRYKNATWRIILPPMLASFFTLAILMAVLPGVNLFHFMALILVLGIGIDMGIFLTETSGATQTWLAVTLSVLTSLMAFGLLALSQTPVLMHFGLTVLLGLSWVWILATFFRRITQGESVEGNTKSV